MTLILVRLGMLKRQRDEEREKNTELITNYLVESDKEARKTKGRQIRLPVGIKKTSGKERYKITRLGTDFLKMIDDTKKNDNGKDL